MKTLYIMCGAPGAGKSTYIKNHLAKIAGYATVESRDDVRFSLVREGEAYFSREKEVFSKWTQYIAADLREPGVQNVFADATHLTVASRRKLINALNGALSDVRIVCIVIDSCLAKCLAQNEQRVGTRYYVPESAIRNMFSSFEMPNFEYEPYIDEIYIVRNKSTLIKERV